MECRQIQFHLMAYLDGDLAASSVAQMERHMLGCRACRLAHAELGAFDASIKQAFQFPGTPYAYRQLAARIPDVTPLDEVAAFLPRLRVSGRAPRLAVAALMLVMLVMGQFTLRQGRVTLSAAKEMANSHDQRIRAAYLEYIDTEGLKSVNKSCNVSI